jgi:CubicO group peptidase (beta-lactamase class C family)
MHPIRLILHERRCASSPSRIPITRPTRVTPITSTSNFAAGAGGQNTWIVPSHQLVIVRMGHMRGAGPARRRTNEALSLVMQAVGEESR